MLNLVDIKPGDEIEYEQSAGRLRAHLKISKGIVIQVTASTITIKGERYPLSILINDLVSGQAKIIKLRGEDFEMQARKDRDEKTKKAQELIAGGLSVSETAKQIGVPFATLYGWLKQEKKQTPDPNPVQVGRQEPDQEKEEPAVQSLPEVEVPVNTQYNPSDNDFNTEDEEPISSRLAEKPIFNLDRLKINLIEAVLDERDIGNIPNNLTLALILLIGSISQQRLVEFGGK